MAYTVFLCVGLLLSFVWVDSGSPGAVGGETAAGVGSWWLCVLTIGVF